MSDFNLHQLVKTALAEGGCDTPRAYAERVLDRIPAKRYRDALAVTLTDYVRHVNRDATDADTVRSLASATQTPGSRKVAGIAAAWAQMLTRQIPTQQGGLRVLADATPTEIRFYASMLDEKARKAQEAAVAYRELADLMSKHKVGRVRDLPPALGAPVMQKAAA